MGGCRCLGLYGLGMGIPHARLRLGGYLYSADQDWSIGLNFVPGGGPVTSTPAEDLIALTAWRDRVRALNNGQIAPANLLSLLSAAGTITTIRCSTVGADGREIAVAQVDLDTPVTGSGAPVHPSQMCLVLSTLSDRPGGSYRGRVYWPALRPGVNTAGRLDLTSTAGYAADAASWIAALGNAGDSGQNTLVPSVVSTTKSVSVPITAVRVGDRLDVQRRRADGQQERYSRAVVAQ